MPESSDQAMSKPRKILANGASQYFLTSLKGYTQFNIRALGDEAEVVLSWVDSSGKARMGEVVVAGKDHSEYFVELFEGSKVNITNQSQKGSEIEVTPSLG